MKAESPTPAAARELARLGLAPQLEAAGGVAQDFQTMNLRAALDTALREFSLATGQADWLLYASGKVIGIVEAEPPGRTPACLESQSAKYAVGPPNYLPVWHCSSPFA